MASGSRLRAWLELSRISNGPTVVSNVLTGCALGAVATGEPFPWRVFAMVVGPVLALYFAGMIHNDVMDAGIDREERPTRPLPSGRVSRELAGNVVAVLLGIGVLGLYPFGTTVMLLACGLALCIVVYNATHQVSAATVLLLGACRAMVYITAAAAVSWPVNWAWVGPAAAILAGYVIVLSVIARTEAGRPGRIRVVVAMLRGISLLDAAILLIVLAQPVPASAACGCFAVTWVLHKRIMGS